MLFGVVGRMGPGMWLVVGFRDQPTGRVLLGATLRRSCAKVPEPPELRFAVVHGSGQALVC